jgi:hypothetical protein
VVGGMAGGVHDLDLPAGEFEHFPVGKDAVRGVAGVEARSWSPGTTSGAQPQTGAPVRADSGAAAGL